MFLFDPVRGARRRALLRDKVARASRKTVEAADATVRDIGNRIEGVQSRARNLFASETVEDAALEERVKSALGRRTAHHRAITIQASNGWVALNGDVLESERRSILTAVERVRGVAGVQHNLRTHLTADIPALQGGVPVPGQWRTWLQGPWSPTTVVAGGAAIALAAAAVRRFMSDREATAVSQW